MASNDGSRLKVQRRFWGISREEDLCKHSVDISGNVYRRTLEVYRGDSRNQLKKTSGYIQRISLDTSRGDISIHPEEISGYIHSRPMVTVKFRLDVSADSCFSPRRWLGLSRVVRPVSAIRLRTIVGREVCQAWLAQTFVSLTCVRDSASRRREVAISDEARILIPRSGHDVG